MKVHLIDGTYELFRSHFGAPKTLSPGGVQVGAVVGMLRSMASLLRQSEVTHVGFAFDTTSESFRNQLFDGYKTGESTEPALWNQIALAERAAEALGMVVWSMVEFEADDALATAAKLYSSDERVTEVVICSSDKDLCQCIRGDSVSTYDRMRKIRYNSDSVVEKFGVQPESIPDYLGLVGDTSDGFPGLKGWGAKSAAAVLAHYHRIENIPDDEGEWPFKMRGAATLAKVLREERESAMLYKDLATLRLDVPISETLDELRWSGVNREQIRDLCAELGMETR